MKCIKDKEINNENLYTVEWKEILKMILNFWNFKYDSFFHRPQKNLLSQKDKYFNNTDAVLMFCFIIRKKEILPKKKKKELESRSKKHKSKHQDSKDEGTFTVMINFA